jgi:spermidine synthase
MPSGFAAIEWLDGIVYGLSPALAPGLQIVAIVVALGPPTLAMGATLPLFPLLARAHGLSISQLYGLNTAGAGIGLLLLSFLVLPVTGALLAGGLVAAVNLGVFASALRLSAAAADAADPAATYLTPTTPRIAPALAGLLVFATGFATFGLEVAWFRSLRAAFQATTETFAIILASVLLPLAIGARLVPALRRRGIHPAVPLACAGVAILLVTPLVERADLLVYAWKLHLGDYWRRLLVSSALLGPPMLCLGVVLPWCLEEFSRPAQVARLYATNTLASVLGSILAAWLLLPTLGFARTAWLIGAGIALLATVATRGRLARVAVGTTGAASLLIAMGTTASLGHQARAVRADRLPGGPGRHDLDRRGRHRREAARDRRLHRVERTGSGQLHAVDGAPSDAGPRQSEARARHLLRDG